MKKEHPDEKRSNNTIECHLCESKLAFKLLKQSVTILFLPDFQQYNVLYHIFKKIISWRSTSKRYRLKQFNEWKLQEEN